VGGVRFRCLSHRVPDPTTVLTLREASDSDTAEFADEIRPEHDEEEVEVVRRAVESNDTRYTVQGMSPPRDETPVLYNGSYYDRTPC